MDKGGQVQEGALFLGEALMKLSAELFGSGSPLRELLGVIREDHKRLRIEPSC